MDELLEIVMRDKAWNDELARKTYVAILRADEQARRRQPAAGGAEARARSRSPARCAAAPADPVVDEYRRKLSMALF